MIFLTGIRIKDNGSDAYPFDIPAVRHITNEGVLSFKKPVTFLIGENGAGKSTLIEAIAVAMGFNAEGGSRDHSFSTQRTHSALHESVTALRSPIRPNDGFFLRAESFYNTASYLDSTSPDMARYGGRSFHSQSHGEAFLSLVANRFMGCGLYILDEPESALSPQRLMSLIIYIDELVKHNSQFIIATHSPILMAYPDSEILLLDETGVSRVQYRETEHYIITRQFMEDPERMLKYLLS